MYILNIFGSFTYFLKVMVRFCLGSISWGEGIISGSQFSIRLVFIWQVPVEVFFRMQFPWDNFFGRLW